MLKMLLNKQTNTHRIKLSLEVGLRIPATLEAEAEGSQVQGPPWLLSELKASLDNLVRPCLVQLKGTVDRICVQYA